MTSLHSKPLALKNVTVTDSFWRTEQELVRTAVIPYQWNALNDNVPGAAPSYCMHNFKAAAAQNKRKDTQGKAFVPPKYTFRGFEALPEDPANPDPDKFYGFVFQDTDFSKWVEAVGYSLAHHPDPALEQTADQAIDVVCAAQLDNGYLDTCYILNDMDRAFTNLRDHHELYCLGHLVEGAVAYYQGTGKDKLLKAACRFADYVDERFGRKPGQLRGCPGHEIAEMALVRLYEVTGEQRYLDLAEYFVTERGRQPYIFDIQADENAKRDADANYKPNTDPNRYAYHQANKPVTEQDEAVGHAVRAGYFYSGLADVARLADDQDLADAAERLWRNIVDKKLYVTGGIGGTYAVMPELYLKIYECYHAGRMELAREIQNECCRIIYKMCSCHGNLYAVMKEILRREGMDVGTVRAPLPNLVASDMDTVVCAKQMIEEAVQKYVKA